MNFIFGGAYQGMEDCARQLTGAQEICMLDETATQIDFSAPIIGGLDRFVLGCVRREESAVDYFRAHEGEWSACTLIGTDFSCGVVPMDAQLRFWREENGRLNNYLAARADRVLRCFCGIAQQIK